MTSSVTVRDMFRRAVSCIWLVSFLFTSLTVLAFNSPDSPDLVFCPLQKQWVKKTPPRPVRSTTPLAEICASGNSKTLFARSLVLNLRPGVGSVENADLFFKFLGKGDRAFNDVTLVPGLPNLPPKSLERVQNSDSIGRVGSYLHAVMATAPEFLSWQMPPPAYSVFNLADPPKFAGVSRSLSPRAPPVSL